VAHPSSVLRGLTALSLLTVAACGSKTEAPAPTQAEAAKPAESAPAPAAPAAEGLAVVWQLEGFKHPESARYDAAHSVIYLTNVNGGPGDADGNGFVSKLKPDGTVEQLEWITGLNAPKGIGLAGNKLYVADLTELLEIDIDTGSVAARYTNPGMKFLNDVDVGADGTVYVTDTFANVVWRLKDGAVDAVLEDKGLDQPNGVFVSNGQLLIGSWGETDNQLQPVRASSLKWLNLGDATLSAFGDNIGQLDGVEGDGGTGFYVTDFTGGRLLHVDASGAQQELAKPGFGAADIGLIPAEKLLLVPVMMADKLIAYRLP